MALTMIQDDRAELEVQGRKAIPRLVCSPSFGSTNQNHGKGLENKGIPGNPWKTTKGSRPHLKSYSTTICDFQEFLVCNQEVEGSIPFVS
jgi:hypothetical protein